MRTIIITGPSSSGKSYLSKKLSNLFKDSIIIKTDSYYRDNILIKILSKYKVDIYDRIISIRKEQLKKNINSIYNKDKLISFPNYNFKSKNSHNSLISINYKDENQFLIIEGVFSHCLELNYHKTINILCDVEKDICYKRRLIRDKEERGRTNKEVIKKFNSAWSLFFKNIQGFQKFNKVIVLNPADKISYDMLIKNLQTIKKK